MHEFGLMQKVVASILSEMETQGVTPSDGHATVTLRVGAFAFHSEESFRQAFTVLTKDTPLRDARLILTVIPATIRCGACGYSGECPTGDADTHDPSPIGECPACNALAPLSGGNAVECVELSFDTAAATG